MSFPKDYRDNNRQLVKTSARATKKERQLTLFRLFVRRLDCLELVCGYFSKDLGSLMITIVQSGRLNVIFRKFPAVFL